MILNKKHKLGKTIYSNRKKKLEKTYNKEQKEIKLTKENIYFPKKNIDFKGNLSILIFKLK